MLTPAKSAAQKRYLATPAGRLRQRAAHRRWKDRNRERVRALAKGYQRSWRASSHGRLMVLAYGARVPVDVRLAWAAVADAVRTGKLVRKPCAECGDPVVHGHHHRGYASEHRLDVIWLCALHHAAAHRSAGPLPVMRQIPSVTLARADRWIETQATTGWNVRRSS